VALIRSVWVTSQAEGTLTGSTRSGEAASALRRLFRERLTGISAGPG